jgi:hypothetical protein
MIVLDSWRRVPTVLAVALLIDALWAVATGPGWAVLATSGLLGDGSPRLVHPMVPALSMFLLAAGALSVPRSHSRRRQITVMAAAAAFFLAAVVQSLAWVLREAGLNLPDYLVELASLVGFSLLVLMTLQDRRRAVVGVVCITLVLLRLGLLSAGGPLHAAGSFDRPTLGELVVMGGCGVAANVALAWLLAGLPTAGSLQVTGPGGLYQVAIGFCLYGLASAAGVLAIIGGSPELYQVLSFAISPICNAVGTVLLCAGAAAAAGLRSSIQGRFLAVALTIGVVSIVQTCIHLSIIGDGGDSGTEMARMIRAATPAAVVSATWRLLLIHTLAALTRAIGRRDLAPRVFIAGAIATVSLASSHLLDVRFAVFAFTGNSVGAIATIVAGAIAAGSAVVLAWFVIGIARHVTATSISLPAAIVHR